MCPGGGKGGLGGGGVVAGLLLSRSWAEGWLLIEFPAPPNTGSHPLTAEFLGSTTSSMKVHTAAGSPVCSSNATLPSPPNSFLLLCLPTALPPSKGPTGWRRFQSTSVRVVLSFIVIIIIVNNDGKEQISEERRGRR